MEYKRIDKYEFIKKIGQGGMSKIYKVRDVRLKKYWAVKVINLEKQAASEQTMNKRILEDSLLREMEILKNLEHPALPGIVDYFKTEKKMYIVMDYIEGENLKEKVEREGIQKEEHVLEWALQLCDVLEYLHGKKIIYRDLKPSNIMINKDKKVKLIDFGTARIYKKSLEEDTMYLGTKAYAAPEQFGGQGQTDARTDIYSLGKTLSYLLYGELRTQIETKKQMKRQLGRLEKIIEKCMQINPAERYQSCKELKEELIKSEKRKKGRDSVPIKREKNICVNLSDINKLTFDKFGKESKRNKETFDLKKNKMNHSKIIFKRKIIVMCVFLIFCTSGVFWCMKKNMKDVSILVGEPIEAADIVHINKTEYVKISMMQGMKISKTKKTSKSIQTSEPQKVSKLTQTSEPQKVSKLTQTSEPIQTLEPMKTSKPIKTPKPIKTSIPTIIPEMKNKKENVKEEKEIMVEIIE